MMDHHRHKTLRIFFASSNAWTQKNVEPCFDVKVFGHGRRSTCALRKRVVRPAPQPGGLRDAVSANYRDLKGAVTNAKPARIQIIVISTTVAQWSDLRLPLVKFTAAPRQKAVKLLIRHGASLRAAAVGTILRRVRHTTGLVSHCTNKNSKLVISAQMRFAGASSPSSLRVIMADSRSRVVGWRPRTVRKSDSTFSPGVGLDVMVR